jgi:ABC-type glycerol-3-phosphate transport system substrate-binding protein
MFATCLIARRRLLASAVGFGATALLAACAAPTPTPVPPKPTEAPKPAAPAPAAAPTTAPAAAAPAPVKPAEAPKPAAEPTKPAAAAAPAVQKPAAGPVIPMRLHVRSGPEEDLWPIIVPRFEQENNVKMELVQSTGGEHIQKMQTLVAGGQLGDVIHNFTGDSSFQLFFASGVAIQLDKFVNDEKFELSQYYKFCVDICKIDGRLGGLPFKGHPSRVGMFYNRTVIEAAGAKVPTNDSTYDDLIEIARKAHKQTGSDLTMGGWSNPGDDPEWYILMSRFMGSKDIYSKDGTKALLNDPEVSAGWAWTYDMFNKHKVGVVPLTTNPTTIEMFLNGKLALIRANVGQKAAWANIKEFKWGMAVAPKGPKGQRGSLSQADVVGVTKFSKVPELGWKFLKLMTSKEAGITLGKQTGNKSATPGGRPDVYESDDLLKLPFPEDTQKNTMIAMKEAEPFTQPANYRGPEIQRAIKPLYESLLLDKSKPDKAFFDQLNQAVQDILDKPKP